MQTSLSTSTSEVQQTFDFGKVQYQVESLISKDGLTSTVYKAAQICAPLIEDEQTIVAIKSVHRDYIKGFQDEVNCLHNCGNHPNIVQMKGFLGGRKDSQQHAIALEYCESDLFNLVSQSQGLNEDVCRHLFANQIVPAVDHLHKLGICHRDLKLDNILLKGDQCKVADFTFGASMRDAENNLVIFTQQCGTKQYMAPEIQRGCKYLGAQVDVYSLGVCLFMMHMCQMPFPTGQYYHWLWKKPNMFWSQFVKKPSKQFKELVQGMLNVCPEKRFTLDQVKAHQWTTLSIA